MFLFSDASKVMISSLAVKFSTSAVCIFADFLFSVVPEFTY